MRADIEILSLRDIQCHRDKFVSNFEGHIIQSGLGLLRIMRSIVSTTTAQARGLRLIGMVVFACCCVAESWGQQQFSKDQQLVIAAYDLDGGKVKKLLDDGANPNARLGIKDEHLFEDKWLLGFSPVGSDRWTPLLAVANAHREPQPTKRTENSVRALVVAERRKREINPQLIRERDERRLAIAKLLVAARANLDLDDGHGSTPLASVIPGYEELALFFIENGANINTQTGVYIDGPSGYTPLHQAVGNPMILAALLKRNAKLEARDSRGETSLHWAVRKLDQTSVNLLLMAGTDPTSTNSQGHTPAYWCETHGNDPDRKTKQAIEQLLHKAIAERNEFGIRPVPKAKTSHGGFRR